MDSANSAAAEVAAASSSTKSIESSIMIPNKLINNHAYSDAYESGITTDNIKTKNFDQRFLCSICHGLPRYPVLMPNCPHVLCAYCAVKHVETSGTPSFYKVERRNARCPECRQDFKFSEYIPFMKFHSINKVQLMSIDVECSYKCGYAGTIFEVDQHETFSCSLREIQCPHFYCDRVGPAGEISKHYATCGKQASYCGQCVLPVSMNEFHDHDCIKRLKIAVSGITLST